MIVGVEIWSQRQAFHPHFPIYKIGALVCHTGIVNMKYMNLVRHAGAAPAPPAWKTGILAVRRMTLCMDNAEGTRIICGKIGDAGGIRTPVRRVAAACLATRPQRLELVGGIRRIRTDSASFTGRNADSYTMIPISMKNEKLALPPGLAPGLPA